MLLGQIVHHQESKNTCPFCPSFDLSGFQRVLLYVDKEQDLTGVYYLCNNCLEKQEEKGNIVTILHW